jgi:hypothetical protein
MLVEIVGATDMGKPDQVRETSRSQFSRDLAAATARRTEFRVIAAQLAKHEVVAEVWDDAIALMSDPKLARDIERNLLNNYWQSGVLRIPPDLIEKAREVEREVARDIERNLLNKYGQSIVLHIPPDMTEKAREVEDEVARDIERNLLDKYGRCGALGTPPDLLEKVLNIAREVAREVARDIERNLLDNYWQSGVLHIPPDLMEKAREVEREMAVERLLWEIWFAMNWDAFAPSGSGNRLAMWTLLHTSTQKKKTLTVVAKCARALAEAMHRCAGADQFGAELLGVDSNDGAELPRRLEKLAEQAESRRVYALLAKPNRHDSRVSFWMRMLDKVLPRRLGEDRLEGRRNAVITALVGAMLDLKGTLDSAKLRNSTKKKPNKNKSMSLSRPQLKK